MLAVYMLLHEAKPMLELFCF